METSEAAVNAPNREEGVSAPVRPSNTDGDAQKEESTPTKSVKRRLFGLVKKKDDDKSLKPEQGGSTSIAATPPRDTARTSSPFGSERARPSSPGTHHYTSIPRPASPASSFIFERNVQETAIPVPTSPAIPGHIQTENHIPPVLEASSLAITNDHLNPDNVEIVTHAAHQPAALTVTGASASEGPWQEEPPVHSDHEDGASTYGALDTNDVRRLSFISFADVVQSEHVEQSASKESVHLAGLTSTTRSANRSPSPMRSPGSSHGPLGTSPPTSAPGSVIGSPGRDFKNPISPVVSAHSSLTGGELTIETMRQALRKTGSGDLSGARSQPMSAVSEGASDRPWT